MCDVLNFSFKLRNQQHLGYLDGQPADLSTFRRAWTNELPWIRIANSVLLDSSAAVVCTCLDSFVFVAEALSVSFMIIARKRCLQRAQPAHS